MDDGRFTRLETRVDTIKDDVATVKAEQKVMAGSIEKLHECLDKHNEIVEKHILGDNKIINEITPVLDEFKFQQEVKKRRMSKLKSWSLKLGIPATLVGIAMGIVKIWTSF